MNNPRLKNKNQKTIEDIIGKIDYIRHTVDNYCANVSLPDFDHCTVTI